MGFVCEFWPRAPVGTREAPALPLGHGRRPSSPLQHPLASPSSCSRGASSDGAGQPLTAECSHASFFHVLNAHTCSGTRARARARPPAPDDTQPVCREHFQPRQPGGGRWRPSLCTAASAIASLLRQPWGRRRTQSHTCSEPPDGSTLSPAWPGHGVRPAGALPR